MLPWLLYTAGVLSHLMAWKKLAANSNGKAVFYSICGVTYVLSGAVIHVGPNKRI